MFLEPIRYWIVLLIGHFSKTINQLPQIMERNSFVEGLVIVLVMLLVIFFVSKNRRNGKI